MKYIPPAKSTVKPAEKKISAKPAPSKSPSSKPAFRKPASAAPTAPATKLDGSGQPFITLAQFLKAHNLAETGGSAKHVVRAGGIAVNGEEEIRPGRKLHTGDVVVVGGKKMTVTVGAATV